MEKRNKFALEEIIWVQKQIIGDFHFTIKKCMNVIIKGHV